MIKVKRSPVSLTALVSIIVQLSSCSQPQRTVQSMNIHSSPSSAALRPYQRNDRLTNAWRTIAGQDPGGRFNRWTDTPTGIKGVTPLGRWPFPCKLYYSCKKVACCMLSLAAAKVLTFNFYRSFIVSNGCLTSELQLMAYLLAPASICSGQWSRDGRVPVTPEARRTGKESSE